MDLVFVASSIAVLFAGVLSVVSLCGVVDSDTIPSTRSLLLLLCSLSAFHMLFYVMDNAG